MGLRGHKHHRKLLSDYDEIDNTTTIIVSITKGRNAAHIEARNKKLVHRYYFKARVQRLQYESLLKELVQEFNICEKTIYNILFVDESHLISEVMKEKPSVHELGKLYPYFSWKA